LRFFCSVSLHRYEKISLCCSLALTRETVIADGWDLPSYRVRAKQPPYPNPIPCNKLHKEKVVESLCYGVGSFIQTPPRNLLGWIWRGRHSFRRKVAGPSNSHIFLKTLPRDGLDSFPSLLFCGDCLALYLLEGEEMDQEIGWKFFLSSLLEFWNWKKNNFIRIASLCGTYLIYIKWVILFEC
jgi:hypothetical protein